MEAEPTAEQTTEAAASPDEETAESQPGAPAASKSAPPSPDEVWPRVLELARPRLRAMLGDVRVQQATPKLLKLGVPEALSGMARDHLPDIVRLVQETGARSMSIQFVDIKPRASAGTANTAGGASPGASNTGQTDPAAAAAPPPPLAPGDADNHPLVRRAAEVFGAKVTHIHPKRR